MAEPITVPFGGLTWAGPRNHVLDGGPDQMNPLEAARSDNPVMWFFCQIILDSLSLVKLVIMSAVCSYHVNVFRQHISYFVS